MSVRGYVHVDTFYLYIIEYDDRFNLYQLLDWWSVKYAHIKTFFILFLHVWFLTQGIAEIQMFISEQGAFPFVIVWVWQQGAWKYAPM